MDKKSISRTLLVKLIATVFLLLAISGCGVTKEDMAVVSDYSSRVIIRHGKDLENTGKLIKKYVKNIVESSPDADYVNALCDLRKDCEQTLKNMSELEVPEEVKDYHDLILRVERENYYMIGWLLKSSASTDANEKKLFSANAEEQAKKVNILMKEARRKAPNIVTLLKILFRRK